MTQFAGIILAAGKAERFGSPKILLDWKGKPLIRYIAEQVLGSGFSQVAVVLGATIDPAVSVLEDLPISIVVNRRYAEGMGTSFSAGITALEQDVDGAFIFLGDHPFVDAELIKKMKTCASEADVIYPVYEHIPGHPVLWNKRTFSRIQSLPPGQTGKELQKEFHCLKIPWGSRQIVLDIDTQDDYKELLGQ